MKHLAIVACIAALSFGTTPTHATETPRPVASTATMDAVFQKLGSQMVDADLTDSLSIAVVRDGQTHVYNFGSTVRGAHKAATERTVYEIASITKTFTSLILAHAVVEGKIDPNADIRTYLPPDYPQLAFGGKPVTIAQLANTTSALPDNLPDVSKLMAGVPPEKLAAIFYGSLKDYTPAQLLIDLKAVKLDRPPGVEPRHSNVAAELLGIILERVYKDSYANLLSRYVEKPFGMTGHGTDEQAATIATGYDEKHAVMPPLRGPAVMPAGGLRYGSADMAKFLQAQLKATDPAVKLSHTATWGNPNEFAFGYNWIFEKTIDGQRHLRTSGGAFGFSSYIEMYPDKGYGIVLLANRAGSAQEKLHQLADAAYKDIFGMPAVLTALHDAMEKDNYQHVDTVAADVRRDHPELNLTEGFVNQWGYNLLSAKRSTQAIALFVYNTKQWPKSANAFDSLGEAYEGMGEKAKALDNYKRSLVLNPSNQHAIDRLKAMDASAK
ncbi:MAG: Protein flp [Luteibacter sp.]|uniref:serine hydrolase n=1 Tax=Luteibacter sp. TaxID=1886636 RepID=UPI001384A6CB|nr:serine hydrolase [Luteibacter sp.]KAF1008259.1 MAG: Protein flp [Luteibacter sp.]